MSFAKAVRSGFRNWKFFGGRASRAEYWYFQLFLFLATLAGAFALFFLAAFGGEVGAGFGILALLAFSIFVFVPALSLTIRRLRDGGFHWALIFLTFVPLGGVALFIMLLLPTAQKTADVGQPSAIVEQEIKEGVIEESTQSGAAGDANDDVKRVPEARPEVTPLNPDDEAAVEELQVKDAPIDKGVKEKLARLEQLHAKGRISGNQLSAARSKLMGED